MKAVTCKAAGGGGGGGGGGAYGGVRKRLALGVNQLARCQYL